MTQEERKRLAIERLAPKNDEDYRKVFQEWLGLYQEEHLQAFEKNGHHLENFYVRWSGINGDTRDYLSSDVEGIMTNSVLTACMKGYLSVESA